MTNKFFILTGILLSIVSLFVIPKILNELVLFAYLLLALLSIVLLWMFYNFLLFIRNFELTHRAKRQKLEYEAKATRYQYHQDGFGMGHLLNVETGIVENLSTYPGTHHNGQWEEPPEKAMLAWFALVARNKDVTSEALQLTAPQEVVPDLLPILDGAERVLVKGPTNSGKTTLFQNIADRTKNVIVIDPHYAPGLWPGNCKIIGAGRNHEEITQFFRWVSQELDRRYKLRAIGDENYQTITIIIDEWMSIASKCDNATQIITEMITESRKSKMRLFIGSHSDQVESLGIRGQGKLREGLLIVRLHYDQFTGERSTTFDYGKGERPCRVPISYNQEEEVEIKLPDLVIQPDELEKRIIDLFEQELSFNKIAKQIYGRTGGNQTKEIKEVLKKFGYVNV